MKIVALALAAVLLAACTATTPPKPDVVEVFRAVREPCIEHVPTRPAYQFGKGPMPDERTRSQLLIQDFEAAEQYGTAWEAAAAGCIKPPLQPSNPPSTAIRPNSG